MTTLRPDATAAAALDQQYIRPVWFGYFDFAGDPLRANSSGHDITLTGTGDAELDGFAFIGVAADLIDVSEVTDGQGGSETVTVQLSGLPAIDADLYTLLGNPANWQGRVARLWRMIRDAAGTQQGALQAYRTAYMTAVTITGSDTQQIVTVSLESYLAAFSAASNRTYQDQERYDPGDLSARAAIQIANGTSGNPLTGSTPAGSGVSSGGRGPEPRIGQLGRL